MRAIDRSTDRPIDRYRLLRQPKWHNQARSRQAVGRRARSTDRQPALLKPTGYYNSLGGTSKRRLGKTPGDARDRPIDRSTDTGYYASLSGTTERGVGKLSRDAHDRPIANRP